MAEILDLLGDPIPTNFGGRGRPPHIPTVENRSRVMLLQAMGWKRPRIAAALGVTEPTLKKHYFRELRFREEARPRVEARVVEALYKRSLTGAAAPLKLFLEQIRQQDVDAVDETFRPAADRAAPRLGKKDQRREAARGVGGIYTPGAAPKGLTSH